MNEAILAKLEARLDRRTFLRGSALAAAALLGVAAASPVITFAQAQDKPQSDDKKKDDDGKKDEPKDEKPYRTEGPDGKFHDRQGAEVRETPGCGHNHYQHSPTRP